MIRVIRVSLHPLAHLNRRILIGGGGLTLFVIAHGALILWGPFA